MEKCNNKGCGRNVQIKKWSLCKRCYNYANVNNKSWKKKEELKCVEGCKNTPKYIIHDELKSYKLCTLHNNRFHLKRNWICIIDGCSRLPQGGQYICRKCQEDSQ